MNFSAHIRRALAANAQGNRLLTFLRFCRKLPALWRQELCIAEHDRHPWSDNRIFVFSGQDFYPLYCPDEPTESGGYLRTYNVFIHQASAWYMRREVANFIHYARTSRCFADIGSAEGFYSALFASMHRKQARILSVDCGSITGCNPFHTPLVLRQNREIFRPAFWQYRKAFVTDEALQAPEFPLPADCEICRLPDLLNQESFLPDLIKFDIESSEYEVLLDSCEWLARHGPTLIVEIHNEFLRPRGLDFRFVLKRLAAIGYRVVASDCSDYLKADNAHVVLQMNHQA